MINIRTTRLAIFPLAVILLYYPLTSIAKTFSAKVVRVIDGDTVQAYDGATNTRIRLYGIDAPESKQAFGQKAKQTMIQLVANQVVNIQDHGQDVYGRILGTIYLNNNDVKEGANKRGNSSRLTQSFHFFMFEPIFSPVNALNQPI